MMIVVVIKCMLFQEKVDYYPSSNIFQSVFAKILRHLFPSCISPTHLALHSDLVTYLLNQHPIDVN